VSCGNIQGPVVAPRISESTAVVSLNTNKRSVLVTETHCHIILIPLLNYAVICHDYIVSVLCESDMITEHWWMTVTGQDWSMWRKTFFIYLRVYQKPENALTREQTWGLRIKKKGDTLIFSW